MSQPLISVVVPTRNRADSLARAVSSVLAQTYRNFELLIVDDASGEEAGEILSRIAASDGRIRVLRNPVALGGAGARNVGISSSRGSWIAFLDDDDEWASSKLEYQLAAMCANRNAVACSCSYVRHSALGIKSLVKVPDGLSLSQLLRGNVLGGASMCFCLSDVIKEIGGFDARFKSAQDWDLWVRLRKKGNIVSRSEPLVRYQAHNGARISNNMQSQYLGARRFYFKHRQQMDKPLRRHRVSSICFFMSRQTGRDMGHRIRYLAMAAKYSSLPVALSYVKSSLPRMIRDAAFGVFRHLGQ